MRYLTYGFTKNADKGYLEIICLEFDAGKNCRKNATNNRRLSLRSAIETKKKV